jgi:ferredoxin
MAEVYFQEDDIRTETEEGANLRKVARKCGAQIYGGINKFINCRGFGFCGTDRVIIDPEANVSPRTWKEKLHFDARSNVRLACQVRVLGDVSVSNAPAIEYGEQMLENVKFAAVAAFFGLTFLLAFLIMAADWAGRPLF